MLAELAGAWQGEEECLVRKIITHGAFDSHTTEITFPAPVILTSARVGAVPSSAAQQHTRLFFFAADVAAPTAARFVQLSPAFEQPQTGTRVVQLQPCATTRVLLRGHYQTVPLSLYGYPLAEAAAAGVALTAGQQQLTLAAALDWLEQRQQSQQAANVAAAAAAAAAADDEPRLEDVPLQPAVAAVLSQLVGYWEQVGTSERRMALHPPPPALFNAAAALADSVSAQLVAGTFGIEPLSTGQPSGQQNQAQQEPEEQQQEDLGANDTAALQTADTHPAAASEGQDDSNHVPELAAALLTEEGSNSLLDSAADMVLGWPSMLGAGPGLCTGAALRCGMAGLSAAVLLCSSSRGSRLMVARFGVALLADFIAHPLVPPSLVRHCVASCLLIARSCGTLGAASLLGLWRPQHGIVWQSQRRQEQMAAGGSEPGRPVALGSMEEEAEELAAADLEEQLPAPQPEEEQEHDGMVPAAAERQGSGQEGAGEDDLEHLWQQQQEQRLHEDEEMFYGDSSSDSEGGAGRAFQRYAEASPLDEDAAIDAQQVQQLGDPDFAAAMTAEGADNPAVELQKHEHHVEQQQQQVSAPSAGPAALVDLEEFGGDVYAELGDVQHPGLASEPQNIAPTGLGTQSQRAADAAAGAAADLEADDLYEGLDLGASVIPQTDGAADSPPRGRRRSHGADPGERWEMGGGGYSSPDDSRGDKSEERDGKNRGSERRDKKRKEKKRKARDRSKERHKDDSHRSRDRRHQQRSRSRQRQAEEESQRRRRRDDEEQQRRRREEERQQKDQQEKEARRREEEERRRQQKAEEERRRQQKAEEDRRRQHREEEERRRQHREEEERRRQHREEEARRQRYREQQQRLEEEQRRMEQEEQKRQQEERQRREEERRQQELRQQRKRERSPAAGDAPEVPQRQQQHRAPEGKLQHTERSPSKPLQSPRASKLAKHGARIQSPKQGAGQQQQRPPPTEPLDEASRWSLHETQQRRRLQACWQRKESAYDGCARHVARLLLEKVQPQRLATLARQLLHLLRAHEAAAKFQAAAEDFVAAHRQDAAAMPTTDASVLAADCGSSLQQLARLLATPLPRVSSSGCGTAAGSLQSQGSDGPLPSLLDAVRSRRLLPLLAALRHSAAHRAALQQQQALPAATQHAPLEAALQHELASGTKALLAALASSRGGRQLLLGDTAVLRQLLLATGADSLSAQHSAAVAGSGVLQLLVAAEAAVDQLCSCSLEGEAVSVAAETAIKLLQECGASGRRAMQQALALRAEQAVPRLVHMLQLHCAVLRAACGVEVASDSSGVGSDTQQQPVFDALLAAAPACAHAGQLLLALTASTHVDLLPSWQHQATVLQLAATAELEQLEALPAHAVVAGLGSAKSLLASLSGAATAVVTVQQQGGLSSLLTYLDSELPALQTSPAEDDVASRQCATVDWPTVEMLFCDPEKLSCCEQALRLLASHMWAPGAAGRTAAYAADSDGALMILLRGVLTGTTLVEASAADDRWQVLAGHSIDVGESAACRRRALSFLAVAARAMSCLLQHLRGSTCPIKAPSLLVGLLRAHAVICSSDESVACMLGGLGEDGAALASTPGLGAALGARCHITSCVRCYVEAAQPWQPAILQQIFWGLPAPGLEPGQAAAQKPAEIFTVACLLGDLFPSEWPAAGRNISQAPPSDRKYRAALATAIEPCSAAFRRLIVAALTSESRLLRAAMVRVLARAAGLGGGMGSFLVDPLLEELQTVAESPAPLHNARRLLEIILPLVYRPAIKSAMLSAPFTSTLAQLLGVVVAQLGSAEEGADALHVCTMIMEVVLVLFNHEVCLNPFAPKEQQQVEDMPPVAEAAPMARALLELLPGMGSNAMIAHSVLRVMAATGPGRQALRQAVVLLHAAATGSETPTGPLSTIAVAQAAQWVANRYWGAAERLRGAEAAGGADAMDGMRSVFSDVVAIMQQICMAPPEPDARPPPPSQQRFVAALQASLQAAAAAGLDVGGDEHRWEAPGASEAQALQLLQDPATRMFWRNVRARAIAQSQASAAHAFRRFARREVQGDGDVTVEASLHPPLTLPRQLHTERASDLDQLLQHNQQPTVELKHERQQQQQQQMNAGERVQDAAKAAVSDAAPKPEPQQAGPVQSAPLHPVDLYGDLAGDQSPRDAGQAAADHSHTQQQAALAQQQGLGEQAASQPAAASGGSSLPAAGLHGAAGDTAQPQQPADVPKPAAESGGSLQALMSSPAKLQALLKDPAALQRLLERHPALMSMLKAKLGKGS